MRKIVLFTLIFLGILVAALISSTFLIISPIVLAVPNDTITVDVNITSLSRITVLPQTLSFTAIPGSTDTAQTVDIYNTGSLNVSQLYAFVDTLEDENQRPYGISNSTYYAAGGVITFKNETYDKYFFAGRIEWNWTEDISNMLKANVNSPASWGFFKNTSYEYNWLVGNGTPPDTDLGGIYCNGTGTQFAFDEDVDNATQETRTPTTGSISSDGGDENWGYFSINRNTGTAPMYESCVAVSTDCTKIYIYTYDMRTNFQTCDNSRYIQFGNFTPSDPPHTLYLNVFIPNGIPSDPGSLNTSTFSVYAS